MFKPLVFCFQYSKHAPLLSLHTTEIEKCLAYKVILYIGIILSLFTAILALAIASVALVRGFTNIPREQGIQILKSKLNSLVNEVGNLEESWNTTVQTLQAKIHLTRKLKHR